MYLLTSDIVTEHILGLLQEASDARLAAVARRAGRPVRPSIARRLVARIAQAVSSAAATIATWSDPAIDAPAKVVRTSTPSSHEMIRS